MVVVLSIDICTFECNTGIFLPSFRLDWLHGWWVGRFVGWLTVTDIEEEEEEVDREAQAQDFLHGSM